MKSIFNDTKKTYQMKKSNTITIFLFALLMAIGSSVNAQEFSKLDKSPMDIAAFPTSYKDANKQMKVIYSRPQLKDRKLSKLAPNGEVWRTGANEAPELVLYKDFNLNGTKIKAGSYSLLTIPGEKEWTIILNSDLNTWGSYCYNNKNDVARITVPTTYVSDSLEAFSIVLDGKDGNIIMHIGWDTLRVSVPFTK
tara:strand:+ start:153 stop:737 length:585 start_codon:yes stop_codon:yes gene_type:complete